MDRRRFAELYFVPLQQSQLRAIHRDMLVLFGALLNFINHLFTISERSWSGRFSWLREGDHAENISAHKPGVF
jgi:hypothetical protein